MADPSSSHILRPTKGTSNGDDSVSQPGDVNNSIPTGFGQDTISPGLGVDNVNGGYDFTVGKEISGPTTDATTHETYYTITDEAAFLANGGDQLNLDYSTYTSAGGVVGTTRDAESTMDEAHAHIRVDGLRVEPIRLGETRLAFALPSAGRERVLCSRTFIPAHTLADSHDPRDLGLWWPHEY